MKTPDTRPDSIETILTALAADPFVIVQWFGPPEDRDVCEPLIRALEDPDSGVRSAAARSLEKVCR